MEKHNNLEQLVPPIYFWNQNSLIYQFHSNCAIRFQSDSIQPCQVWLMGMDMWWGENWRDERDIITFSSREWERPVVFFKEERANKYFGSVNFCSLFISFIGQEQVLQLFLQSVKSKLNHSLCLPLTPRPHMVQSSITISAQGQSALVQKRKTRRGEEEGLVKERASPEFYGCYSNSFFCLYIFRTAASFGFLVAGIL